MSSQNVLFYNLCNRYFLMKKWIIFDKEGTSVETLNTNKSENTYWEASKYHRILRIPTTYFSGQLKELNELHRGLVTRHLVTTLKFALPNLIYMYKARQSNFWEVSKSFSPPFNKNQRLNYSPITIIGFFYIIHIMFLQLQNKKWKLKGKAQVLYDIN